MTSTWMVTLHNGAFVWRWDVVAENEEMARFAFIKRWAGMILSHDVRPSELDVERVAG